MRAQAVDAAKDNIRVNSVSPGSVRTPLLEFAAQQVVGEGNPIEDTIAEFGNRQLKKIRSNCSLAAETTRHKIQGATPLMAQGVLPAV